jgi:hypothetical protein
MDLTFLGPRVDTHIGNDLLICRMRGRLFLWPERLPQQAQLVARCTAWASDLWGCWL